LILIFFFFLTNLLFAERVFYLMGTYLILDELQGKEVKVYKYMKNLEEKLSHFIPNSEISKINKNAGIKPVKVSEETFEVLKISKEIIVKKDGKVLAYGYVDIHRVRTKPEAVLYIISPEGKIELVEVLAFHEPLEYIPPRNWLKLFEGKDINSPLRVKKDIPNVTGATLTARAITKNAKKVLALWNVIFGGKK